MCHDLVENYKQLTPPPSGLTVKSNVRKRPYETGGLGRQGAVRKKKEEVHEQNGHQFVAQQFYQIVRCALCGELLYNASGMQCADCKYLCHKRCFTKVVTKCISKSNADAVQWISFIVDFDSYRRLTRFLRIINQGRG